MYFYRLITLKLNNIMLQCSDGGAHEVYSKQN